MVKTSVRLCGFIFWVRTGQDRNTTRADPEQERAMQRRDQDRARAVHVKQDTSGAPPPPISYLGRPGSEGGDVRYRSATAPSGPALAAGAGPCTKNCEYF